jgi:hypothetical protein
LDEGERHGETELGAPRVDRRVGGRVQREMKEEVVKSGKDVCLIDAA